MTTNIQAAVPYDDVAARMYANDPQLAADMLNACLEEGKIDEFLLAIRHIVKAFGGMHEKSLCNGNPTLKTLLDLVDAVNMRLVFIPKTSQPVSMV